MSTQFTCQNSSISSNSIWPIDSALSDATTPRQSGTGSDDNEGELHIPQSSSITGTSPSDCLLSYPGHSLGGVYLFYRGAVSVFYRPPPHPTGKIVSRFIVIICTFLKLTPLFWSILVFRFLRLVNCHKFSLDEFYGKSTFVGYLIPNYIYIYI